MENKKMYVLKINNNGNENIINVSIDQEQAMAAMREILAQNPNLQINDIWVEEYFYKKTLKILDYKE